MVVDFSIKVAPSYKVAYIIRIGGYTGPNMWRREFNQLTRWAKKRRIRTGKWIVFFIDEWGKKPDSKRRSAACLEIKSKAEPEGKIGIMKLPKQRVVSVTFNPDKVADQRGLPWD